MINSSSLNFSDDIERFRLVCPLTKGPLEYDQVTQEFISRSAGLAYPVRDGRPVMLVSEARPLTDRREDGAT